MLNGKTPHTDLAMWISRIQSKLMAVRLYRLQWLVHTWITKKLPSGCVSLGKNDFFMEGQGTAWSIFSAYAEMKGYNCQEIGDIETVAAFLKEGHPVIISVKPGYFTTTGHIMVMSGVDEKGDFWINDPNDSEEKGHSKRTFTAEEVMNEALNFWAFY